MALVVSREYERGWLLEERQRFLLLLSLDFSCSTSVTRYAETDGARGDLRTGIGTSCRDYFAFLDGHFPRELLFFPARTDCILNSSPEHTADWKVRVPECPTRSSTPPVLSEFLRGAFLVLVLPLMIRVLGLFNCTVFLAKEKIYWRLRIRYVRFLLSFYFVYDCHISLIMLIKI